MYCLWIWEASIGKLIALNKIVPLCRIFRNNISGSELAIIDYKPHGYTHIIASMTGYNVKDDGYDILTRFGCIIK